MASSKELVVSGSWSPEFIQDLLPSVQRTALLYHLSYLCLGSFPKLESLVREQALETQLLFGSSEAVLLKCVSTSSILVSSLFPMLMKAVENNDPDLAVKYLEKARAQIDDIIGAVDDMVKRYDEHNQNVVTCTSDVVQEKLETEKQEQKHSEEIKSLEKVVAKLEGDLRKITKDVHEIEKKIEEKNHDLQNHIKDVSRKNLGFGILAALVPFFGAIINFLYRAATGPGDTAKTQTLNAELSRLTSEKSSLLNKEWSIQVKVTDLQLQLANAKLKLGVIPSHIHLEEVQLSLSRIQKILINLRNFWKNVGTLLHSLKEKNFVGEDLLEDLSDLKEEFLTSIEAAEKCWQRFGECCQRAEDIFRVQSRDAYKFLEIDPAKLSKDEWDEQHKSIMAKLMKINPQEMHNRIE